jgi:putative nucleotidyltransferase with HDIG domain
MTVLPRAARIYVCAVVLAGVTAGGFAVSRVTKPWEILGLAAVVLLCASLSEIVDASGIRSVSLGFVVVIAAIFILGPSAAIVVAAASAFTHTPGGSTPVKRAFNAAQFALAGGAGGLMFDVLHGPVGRLGVGDFPGVLLTLFAVVTAYTVVNHLLLFGILSLVGPRSGRGMWREVMRWTSSPDLVYGLLGMLMAAFWESFGPPTALLLLIPLVVTRTTFASFVDQRRAYDATVAALIQAVETKDHYTRGHSERVALGSVLIARQLGLRDEKVKALRYAGMLHDVGKMGVPTKVLQKQGRLTVPEADAVRAHPARGLEMLGEIEFLQEALGGIYHHHERMDGKGYPLGLRGQAIPEFARVIMVADAFDSMTSNRSYRPAMTIEAAIAELVSCSGVQFDPVMVEAMVTALHVHGWQVQGADAARLPSVGGGPASAQERVPEPRKVSAYTSVEADV